MFVTFEGIDGCGKSTAINLVKEKLEKKGYRVITTREPGGTPLAEKIREILLSNDNSDLCDEAEALLFAASRAQHCYEKIWPSMNSGYIVLCDRWLTSSLAYQGAGRNLKTERVEAINRFGIGSFTPDLEFLLDIPSEVAKERMGGTEKDRMENNSDKFYERVGDAFRNLVTSYDYGVVIDGTKPKEEIAQMIADEIEYHYLRGHSLGKE